MANDKRIRVLYIMGTARSGSTILEILLAHGEGAFGAGELTALVQDGFIDNKACSCGKLFRDCEVWGRVAEELDLSAEECAEWAELQKKIDWHDGFFRQWLSLTSKADLTRYEYYNLKLFQAIQKVTGTRIIVDSSKYAGRALALSRMKDVDLHVICLTRSPEGLMASFQKPNKEEQRPKGPLATLSYYTLVLMVLKICVLLLGKRSVHRVTFENLIADPEQFLTSLSTMEHLDVSPVLHRLREGELFEVGHIVTGNRLRRKGAVRLHSNIHKEFPVGLMARVSVSLMRTYRMFLGC